jgi:hypothetical protein
MAQQVHRVVARAFDELKGVDESAFTVGLAQACIGDDSLDHKMNVAIRGRKMTPGAFERPWLHDSSFDIDAAFDLLDTDSVRLVPGTEEKIRANKTPFAPSPTATEAVHPGHLPEFERWRADLLVDPGTPPPDWANDEIADAPDDMKHFVAALVHRAAFKRAQRAAMDQLSEDDRESLLPCQQVRSGSAPNANLLMRC